jgi:hypothetical protein
MFDFSFGGADTLFYSRRIGLDEHGMVRILGGAHVIGRSGGWDFGGLEMQMAATPQDGGVNVGAARARRRVRNASSYVGGMVTTRVAGDGDDNVAYGLDTQLRLQGNDYLQAAWAQSNTPGREPSASPVEAMRAALRFERRVMVGTGFEASASCAGRAYDPTLGFQSRSDVSTAFVSFGHGWVPPAATRILIYRAGAVTSATLSNTRRVVESAEGGPLWGVRSKSGYRVSLAPRLSLEDLAGPMPIAPGVGVPAGRHEFLHLLAIVETPATRLLSVSMMSDTGAFYDGRRPSILLSPRWQMLPDVEVGGSYQLEDLVFPSRREEVTNHTTRLRVGYMPTTQISFSALVQHSSLQRSLGANLRMWYNPREGVDLWIVYDHAGTVVDRAIPGSTIHGRDEIGDAHGLAGREAAVGRRADENRVRACALVGRPQVLVGLPLRREQLAQHHVVAAAVAALTLPDWHFVRRLTQGVDPDVRAVALDGAGRCAVPARRHLLLDLVFEPSLRPVEEAAQSHTRGGWS